MDHNVVSDFMLLQPRTEGRRARKQVRAEFAFITSPLFFFFDWGVELRASSLQGRYS
jgi:hypothetical protein